MSAPFKLSSLSSSVWGPSQEIPKSLRFSDIPYAPFSKGDKLGKAADWLAMEQTAKDPREKNRKQRDYFHAYGASAASSFAAEEQDHGDNFEVVDNSKTNVQKNAVATTLTRNRRGNNLNTGNTSSGNQNAANNATGQKKSFNNNNNNNQNKQGGNKSFNNFNNFNRRNNWRDEKNDRVRESSVKVEDSWKSVSEVEFHKLSKLNFEVSQGEDLDSYGAINLYNKKIERSSNVPLRIIDKDSYNPTASDDPVIQNYKAKVYTTDSVITQLMCASRSVNSWDIVVTKKNGAIFFDKRDGSAIDQISVDENAQDAPIDSNDSNNVNTSNKLALEAQYINDNFIANSIINEQTLKLKNENPFDSDNSNLLSRGYKYKKFTLKQSDEEEDPTTIVIRTQFDSKDPATNQILSIKAINEYRQTSLDWKTKFNSQRGAIIAAELKNNNNKFSKWTQQAILAGVDTIKLGFVSRSNFKDNSKHSIIGVASYKAQDLANQINFSTGNGWGIVKSYIDIISSQEDGKFVILKNPNAPKLTVYRVPENSFQD